MPKVEIKTDPQEIADIIASDPSVKEAIGKVLATASINIPQSEIDRLEKEIVTKIGPAAPTFTPVDIAKSLIEQLADKEKAATSPSAKKVVKSTKARVSSRAGALAARDKQSDPVMAFLYENCSPGLKLSHGKQNVRLKGPAGSSKTYRARKFASEAGFDETIEVACLSDMEPRDFIAGPIPGEQRDGFRAPFVDGPLARGWRAAREGKTVCIILDEIGNVPKTAKQAFQTCLSPKGPFGEEVSVLTTGRAIEALDANDKPLQRGHADYHEPYVETIEAPFENITIIGTQNVGSEYDCPEDSPAIVARLMGTHVETDADLIYNATIPVMREEFGWGKVTASQVSKVLSHLWKASLDAKKKSLLRRELTLREIMVALAKVSHVTDNPTNIKKALRDTMLSRGFEEWFVSEGHDGRPMPEQVASWKDLVTAKIA